MTIRSYSDLCKIRTFEDRFEYLKLGGEVGESTFGFDRYINQRFYGSREWRDIRHHVILRDNGCDLGVSGYEIHVNPLIHHVNPMNVNDIIHNEDWILNPEYLITTIRDTHNAIHYGAEIRGPKAVLRRSPGDTKLW